MRTRVSKRKIFVGGKTGDAVYAANCKAEAFAKKLRKKGKRARVRTAYFSYSGWMNWYVEWKG